MGMTMQSSQPCPQCGGAAERETEREEADADVTANALNPDND